MLSDDEIEVVRTRVFAASPGGGNPCPVIANSDRLTDAQMLSLARKFGEDTAFILRPRSAAADIRIRYFVPDHEMGVSGHATIAAVTVALSRAPAKSERLRIETSTGEFDVGWLMQGDRYLVTLEQNAPVFGVFDGSASPEEVAHALSIQPAQIDTGKSPILSVSVSRPKLIVPLTDSRVLNGLTPDYQALWKLCDKTAVSGLYAFTRKTDKPTARFEARQFPLRAGFPEDAATGVAAAALGAYLTRYDLNFRVGRHEFRIAQGYAMGAPSLITAIADSSGGEVTRTAVQGSAEITSRETARI